MDHLLAELTRRGGVATRRQLRSVTDRTLAKAVSGGQVVRVGRGRYALPTCDRSRLAAHRLGGVLSHLSAAQGHGWSIVRPPDRPHVAVPLGRPVRPLDRRGVVVHWQSLSRQERTACISTPLRTVIDCAKTLPFGEALAVADSALREGACTHEEIVRAVDRLHGPGVRAARRVAAAADGRAANAFESGLRAIALGVPGLHVVPQVVIQVGATWPRVDLADEELRIVLEADSFSWHGHRAALHRDAVRYDELSSRGWLVLRFSWESVTSDPEWIRSVLVEAVRTQRAGRRRRRRTLQAAPLSAKKRTA